MAEILEREAALFRARRDALDSQVALLRTQIDETAARSGGAAASRSPPRSARSSCRRRSSRRTRSCSRRATCRRRAILTLQRAVAEYEAKHGEHRAELAKARQRTAELELRILSQRNTYVQTATDELKDTTARMFDLEERMRPSKDAAERQQILSPIAGEVVGLRVFTPGAVVGPRDVLMEIVPDDKRLIIEARIRPEDINHVRSGSQADVRLTAYKQRTTPLVHGAVIYVSGDRMVEQQNRRPITWCRSTCSPRRWPAPAT